eukprot:13595782-Alexandrium_andersonii.AAC.1
MCGWGKCRHALGCGPRALVLLALCDVRWGKFSHACAWPWSKCVGAMDDGVQQHLVVAMRVQCIARERGVFNRVPGNRARCGARRQ